MDTIRNITLRNSGAFVAKMEIVFAHKNGKTSTYKANNGKGFAVGNEKTVDLSTVPGIEDGDTVRLRAVVVAGKDKDSTRQFVYKANSARNARFTIKGSTLVNSLVFNSIEGPEETEKPPKYPSIRNFKLVNKKGYFVARMQIIYGDADSGHTEIYEESGNHDITLNHERTLDLSKTPIRDGSVVILRAFIKWGKDMEASDTFIYKKTNNSTAAYEVSGTTLKPKLKRI